MSAYPLLQSLLTKPFVILTGGSGTGKTKLAEAVAAYFANAAGTNREIVAVGADWTDNRHVLGFVNHLRTVKVGDVERPVYQSTKVLDLLLRAAEDGQTPYFLILDEMNLSHVERYFADFLSVMEQAEGKLHLHNEGDPTDVTCVLPRWQGDERGVPCGLPWPRNLFVIGTVNIDETTYMFSPKVLDRANVIEFRVARGQIAEFLKSPTGYPAFERAELGQAEGFLHLARQAGLDDGLEALPEECGIAISRHLEEIFTILQKARFEYGFRTANEVMRYLRVCRHLAEDKAVWDSIGWKVDLDRQVLQKLLPKLHGSMGRIGGLLTELAYYCQQGGMDASAGPQTFNSIRMREAENLSLENAAFPQSLSKLKAMIHSLSEEQFVSFIQ